MEAESYTSISGGSAAFERSSETSQGPGWVAAATWLFLALGIAVRMVRYLVDYPIWHDEAFLAANLWDRGYADLLRALEYGQVAPWLFLAIERTAVVYLGYSELVLRLFPTICSVLSVLVFGHIAGRFWRGTPRLLAVAVFAVAFYAVRHGAEIKPYASDLLSALVILALAGECLRSQRPGRWWWALTAVVPWLIAVSYPAVFVGGAVSLALGPAALRSEKRGIRLACIAYNLVLLASFLAVYYACTVFQADAMREHYRNGFWADSFPPFDPPWKLLVWLLDVHTGRMMAYPVGDRHGASILTLLCVLAGCLQLSRRNEKQLLVLLTGPLGLGLIAAFLGRYPYGNAPRIMLYAAPSICLLMGLGLASLLSRVGRERTRTQALGVIVVGLALLGTWMIGRDVLAPYRVVEDMRARDFARWFWTEQKGELVCLKSDLGFGFRPRLWRVGMSAVYLFQQRKYSAHHCQRRPVDLDPANYSSEHPLRLVAFDELPTSYRAFRDWLAALETSFEARRTETYVLDQGKPGEDWLREVYVELELVPRRPARAIARQTDREREIRR